MAAVVRVRDIMQRDVVTVSPDDTVRRLIDVLADRGITGAPVVDRGGHVVGVVSTYDVLGLAARRLPERARMDYFVTADGDAQLKSVIPPSGNGSVYLRTRVRDIMTPAIFRVRAEATLSELARFLSRAGIHRALVMRRGMLAGLVSVTDVVRAVAEEPADGTDHRVREWHDVRHGAGRIAR